MRRFIIAIFSALPLLILSTLSWASADQTSNNNKIPSQISEYYKAYNFVQSFSSKSERGVLVAFLSSNGPPHEFKSNKRLERIYTLMKKLNAHVMPLDQEIVLPKTPPNQDAVSSELIKIIDVQHQNNEAKVKVLVYGIDSETNSKLIAQYDENKGNDKNLPSEEQVIQMPRIKFVPRKEIHKWVLIDGNWMKKEVSIVLLENGE